MMCKVDEYGNDPDEGGHQPYMPLQPSPARQDRNSPGQDNNEKDNPDWQNERRPDKRLTCCDMYSVCRFFGYNPTVLSAHQIDRAT